MHWPSELTAVGPLKRTFRCWPTVGWLSDTIEPCTRPTFDLAPAQRDLEAPGGLTTSLRTDGLSKTPVTYLDFTVDGDRLFLHLRALAAGGLDFVGVIQDAWPMESAAAIERLLGEAPGDLPDGRLSLYLCPECGDLGCGAVTTRLKLEGEVVTWQHLGWQADYDEEISALGDDDSFPDLTFARDAYERVLREQLTRLRPLAASFKYPYQRNRRLRRERLLSAVRRPLRRR